MKARSKFLCEHSLGMALSAIEIYNKPDFKEREQVFAVLLVGAWESLLKAKLIKDANNRMQAIWVKGPDGRRYKRNRAGQKLTIGLPEALSRCQLSLVVVENVTRLMEVRDAACHLTASSPALPSLVFALGTAGLRNYARLIRDWFDIGLNDYNFFILPLGFSYPFRTLSVAEVEKEPEEIAHLLTLVSQAQAGGRAEAEGYHLVCEIETTFVSAKKITVQTDFVSSVADTASAGAPGQIVAHRKVHIIDSYPYRWTELEKKVKSTFPDVRQHEIHKIIRDHSIKGDAKYSAYNYLSKAAEVRGPKAGTQVLYNEDAVQFVIAQLRQGQTS